MGRHASSVSLDAQDAHPTIAPVLARRFPKTAKVLCIPRFGTGELGSGSARKRAAAGSRKGSRKSKVELFNLQLFNSACRTAYAIAYFCFTENFAKVD